MIVEWTRKALANLDRLHAFLEPVAPDAAAKVVQSLTRVPLRLLDFPRIGERLHPYAPREVRRIIVGRYELRYEIVRDTIVILRIWHTREDRAVDAD